MFNVIQSAVPVACWSCSVGHDDSTLFCPHCSKIQPPPGGDYFSVFSLEPHLNLDATALEREFHRLSRRLHPDRYARATEPEKQWSLADTAFINDAYRTLKDPLLRTEYVLRLAGSEIGEEHSGKNRRDPSRVPADLLEEVFELNMQLEEMKANRKMGEHDAQLEQDLQAARLKFVALLNDVDDALHAEWTRWDAGTETERVSAQSKMVALLDRRRYLSNLVRDVREVLGV